MNLTTKMPPTGLSGDRVTLAHGDGGPAMHDLIHEVFTRIFQPSGDEDQARLFHDALLQPGAQLAFTTDSYVVSPVEFPGGDIGSIAVCGTVNDLAVAGAKPLWLSAAFIIEEGCEIALLRRIVASMQAAAAKAGVQIVTGDTKVVSQGEADKVFVTTSGVGVIPAWRNIRAGAIKPGDVAIVNGVLGDHGAAVLAARGALSQANHVVSDCQCLNALMEAVLDVAPNLHACRDATRGGLAASLNELARASGVSIEIEEAALPFRREVRAICETQGLDPLTLANEGTLVLFVPEEEADAALKAMRSLREGRAAAVIGRAVPGAVSQVTLRTALGERRVIEAGTGAQPPRFC